MGPWTGLSLIWLTHKAISYVEGFKDSVIQKLMLVLFNIKPNNILYTFNKQLSFECKTSRKQYIYSLLCSTFLAQRSCERINIEFLIFYYLFLIILSGSTEGLWERPQHWTITFKVQDYIRTPETTDKRNMFQRRKY